MVCSGAAVAWKQRGAVPLWHAPLFLIHCSAFFVAVVCVFTPCYTNLQVMVPMPSVVRLFLTLNLDTSDSFSQLRRTSG